MQAAALNETSERPRMSAANGFSYAGIVPFPQAYVVRNGHSRIREGCGLAKRGHNEVKESLREMARIYQPKDARKFVREYIRKYRITGGYEDELTLLVERELGRINPVN